MTIIKLFKTYFIDTVILSICILGVLTCSSCSRHKPISYAENATELLQLVTESIRQYVLNTGVFPNEDTLLMNLLENPSIEGWNGPYITEAKESIIKLLSENCIVKMSAESTITITLAGEDGEFGTKDDIICVYELIIGTKSISDAIEIKIDGKVFTGSSVEVGNISELKKTIEEN